MNVLEALGVCNREDAISNLLRYCIEASSLFRDAFLRHICGTPSQITNFRAVTRLSTNSSGIPDLVIATEDSRQKYLVILENKLKADEGVDQTVRYSSADCIKDLKERLGWSGLSTTEAFVFLTLFPDQKPEASMFQSATYDQVLQLARDLPPLEDSLAQLLLQALTSLLARFYSKATSLPTDFLLTKLQETDPLEGGYLYFKAFLHGIPLRRQLGVERTYRSSAQGRRYFGAIISKPSWHPEEMQEHSGKYNLDGSKHFNIHFEPQFDCLSGEMKLYLHYEVNPYNSLSWVRKNISPEHLEEYQRVREEFIEELRRRKVKGVTLGGRSNQVARANLLFADMTVSEASTKTATIIDGVATHIDEILLKKAAAA